MSRPSTLRTQFLSANGLLVVVTVALGAAAAFFGQRDLIRRQVRQAQQEETQAFAQVCRQATLQRNETMMVGYAQMLAARPGLAFAYFVNASGVFRVHTDLDQLHRPLSQWALPRTPVAQETATAEADGEILGTAVLAYHQAYRDELEKRALAGIAQRLLIAAVVAGILGILLAMGLSGWLVHPIQGLGRAAAKLGKGDLSTRVTPGGSREVHELAVVFNQMADGLSEIDRMKDDLISMVSHDLRTPLGGITTYADTLRTEGRGPLNEVQKDYLAIIMENAGRLGRFVSDMLDLAKVKAGRMEYRLSAIPAAAAVKRTADLFHLAAERESGKLEIDAPSELRVLADEAKLDRVLVNLVSNALKFMPDKDGRVKIRVTRKGPDVIFAVSDNGPGIPAQDRERLFRRFSQIGDTQRGEGTGLGLAVVKTFVEAMQGRAWMEDAPGGGTVFYFTLPAGEAS